MRNLTLVLASGAAPILMLTLTACNSGTSGEITTAEGETAEYTIDEDGGETSMTIKSEDGTATVQSGAKVAADLPKGFTPYPGSKVISNAVVNNGDEKGTMMMFETRDPPEKVIAHFRKQAEAAGFDIQMDANMNGSMMIGGERKSDSSSLSVTAGAQEGDATTAQLIIGSKKQ